MRLFNRLFRRGEAWTTPTLIERKVLHMPDYKGWGDSISWLDISKRKVYGFYRKLYVPRDLHRHMSFSSGLKPLVDDIEIPQIIVSGVVLSDNVTRTDTGEKLKMFFVVVEAEYKDDPRDMFFATVEDLAAVPR